MSRVAIIGGLRTPFVKAGTAFSSLETVDLLSHVLKSAWDKFGIESTGLDEVVAGTVLHDPSVPNIAREALFRAGLPKTIGAHSVSNNCITGLVAVNYAAESISKGRISSALAGGAEAMSNPRLTFNKQAQQAFLSLSKARSFSDKLAAIAKFRPAHFVPEVPSPKEPSTGLTMGEHCELMVKEFGVSRTVQDHFAFLSHQNAAKAQSNGYLSEEIAAVDAVSADNIIRSSTTLEKLASLKPVFDKTKSGSITAGNSSALTDGASIVFLMSEERARHLNLQPLGFVEALEFASVEPQDGLLMGPALAVPKLLKRLRIGISDIDLFEIHEAFAGQVICNLLAWEKGWNKYPEMQAVGAIPEKKINPNGGSLALGHPFAATGGRLIISALNQLKRSNQQRALISVCAAGAMGAAMTVTRA